MENHNISESVLIMVNVFMPDLPGCLTLYVAMELEIDIEDLVDKVT